MLYASFLRPEGVYDSYFNKLVAFVTRGGDFCHSEFVFRWSEEEFAKVREKVNGLARYKHHKGPIDVALYVIWGDTVKFRVLNGHGEFFSVPKDNMLPIDVSWEEELRMSGWLWNQVGKPYDELGAILSPLSFRKSRDTYEKYFCSQLMACALQRVGKLQRCNPASLTPNSLYFALKGT